jgi:hypothetical protein
MKNLNISLSEEIKKVKIKIFNEVIKDENQEIQKILMKLKGIK